MSDQEFISKEEVQALVAEALSAGLKDFAATLLPQIEKTVETKSGSWLDELIEEAESVDLDGEYDDDEYDDDDDDDDEDDSIVETLQQQMAQLKANYDAERKQREDAESKQKRDSMMNAAIEGLSKTGKVRNPRQLLTLLQQEGQVFEENGQLVTKSKDQYGLETTIALDGAIDNFLSSEDYAHFAAARGGTGTGATPASGGNSIGGGYKYFNADGTSKIDPGQAMAKDRAGYLAEVAQVQRQQGQG